MSDDKMLRLEGAVENIVYKNEENGYSVIEITDGEDIITAVGIMPQINPGDSVKLIGSFTQHRSYGRQFSVQAYEVCRPTQAADILRYLSSGAVKGIGASTAQRLVKEFGEATLDVMETQPERIALIKGISAKKAEEFAAQLRANTGVRELMLYLGEFGISNTSAVKIYSALGGSAVSRIKENPYMLCGGDFGVSFESAEYIAKKEGVSINSEIRLRAGTVYVLRHNEANGHTCLPKNQLAEITSRFLEVGADDIIECIDSMTFERSLISDNIGGREFIFLPDLHLSEIYISSRIKMMSKFPSEKFKDIDEEILRCEQNDSIEYASMQKQAITSALTESLFVLTGGPGTGKTTTLNAIISILERNGKKVLLAAPTGRAAQRISELTGREAKTLHRLLEVNWDKSDKPVFSKNERNQLKCDALIIDEVSMVDCLIFESVMRALPLGCRLILVGDSDQLPSVGAGNVLSDLTNSGAVTVVRLNEIFRQAQQSLIVTNAHKIVSGEMPVLNQKDNDFFFLGYNSESKISDTIADLCAVRLPKAYGYSAFENIQVLAPSKKGELGTLRLNEKLQARLNPVSPDKDEIKIKSRTFRVGDKVMQIKNNYGILWHKDSGEAGEGIFNGDIGVIERIDKKSKQIQIRFYDKTASLTYENASELEFAYAITVHKSQGNEFDAVIMPMYPGPRQLYYRNLLYTAVTRAKNKLIMVGTPQTVAYMVNNNRKTKRYSGLKEFLMRAETPVADTGQE